MSFLATGHRLTNPCTITGKSASSADAGTSKDHHFEVHLKKQPNSRAGPHRDLGPYLSVYHGAHSFHLQDDGPIMDLPVGADATEHTATVKAKEFELWFDPEASNVAPSFEGSRLLPAEFESATILIEGVDDADKGILRSGQVYVASTLAHVMRSSGGDPRQVELDIRDPSHRPIFQGTALRQSQTELCTFSGAPLSKLPGISRNSLPDVYRKKHFRSDGISKDLEIKYLMLSRFEPETVEEIL